MIFFFKYAYMIYMYINYYIYIYIYIIIIKMNKIKAKEERRKLGYYKSVKFTTSFVNVHVIANSCKSVTFFASFFL